MKSRKAATVDKSQSSLIFFFGKRPAAESVAAAKEDDSDVEIVPRKKVDTGTSSAAAKPSEEATPQRQQTGRRPQGGHLNPGHSRFFSHAKATAPEVDTLVESSDGHVADSDRNTCLKDGTGASHDQVGEGQVTASEGDGGDHHVDESTVAELLLLGVSVKDDEAVTIDLTNEQDDVSTVAASAGNTAATERRVPYYLQNFRFILDSVLTDDDNDGLFDESDMTIITAFLGLSDNAQKLYIRLHNRRKGWHRNSKLEYPEIGVNLEAAIAELSGSSLLETEEMMNDLETMLRLLPAPDVKELAKAFHIQASAGKKLGKTSSSKQGGAGSGGGGKQDLLGSILRHCRQQLSLFSSVGTEAPIRKRAKALLGKCVCLPAEVRNVFARLVHLFAVASWLDDDSQMSNASSTVIYNLLLSSNGSVSYPTYAIRKQTRLFPDRDSFLRFCAALEVECDLLTTKENSNWSLALEQYYKARSAFDQCMQQRLWSYAAERPQFLLRFTDGWVLCRVMLQCVEVLERHRLYEDAVEVLRLLLATPFCRSSRGRCYDRLALDLDQHLKQRVQALAVIASALREEWVVTGHRLALQQRAVRLCTAKSAPEELRNRAEDFPMPDLLVAKEVEIVGRMYPHQGTGKSYFMCNYSHNTAASNDPQDDGNATATNVSDTSSGSNDAASRQVMLLSVEELALEHYRSAEDYECGIHAEGSSFSALFGLFFWEVIFDDSVTDVFRNAYQAMPLDFYTAHFYESRKEKIDKRVEEIRKMDSEMIAAEVTHVWSAHHGTYCGCLNWDLFNDMEQAAEFCQCVGSPLLAGLCSLLAKSFRHRRGGLPDLTLWSKKRNACKFVEVKGPNDRLSHKQHMWMHHLVEMGADVDVCHVRAVGGRLC